MGEKIEIGGIAVDYLVEAEDSNGSQTVFECTIPAASRVPAPHSHDGFEETIYGLEGVCTWVVDDETHEIGPGDVICIRRGQVHGFDNQTDVATKFLAIATPGVFGPQYFREVAEVFADAAGGPPDLVRVGEVMRRHGLTPVPPSR